jgi:adenine C2-methylase RlmN of 23S rRNA A2503 and tRNA A37
MGEPLNNYGAVSAAVSLMTDPGIFALRRAAVTVSTVGVIPRLAQLAEDLPGVSLALSLHAPSQELRQQIVPSARAYKLDRLMDAVAAYQAATQQRVRRQ